MQELEHPLPHEAPPVPSPDEALADVIPWPTFERIGPVFAHAFKLYFENLGLIALVTLLVFIPVEAVKNLWIYTGGMQDDTLAIMRADRLAQFFFGSLTAPAIIYAMFTRVKTGAPVGLFTALAHGVRRWGQTMASRFLVGLRILGGLILLIVPGIIVATRYALILEVVALEGDTAPNILARTRELAIGREWKIFSLFILMGISGVFISVPFGIPYLFFDAWWLTTIIDCILDVVLVLFAATGLSIYLAIVYGPSQPHFSGALPPPYAGIPEDEQPSKAEILMQGWEERPAEAEGEKPG